jgi:predicted nuclease of predicted toxin-antitoxin system
MKFLIDECLTIDLVTAAFESGHPAEHIVRIGKAGLKDWNVVNYARQGDFCLVTNNAEDFRKLYAAEPLHPGLIILIPNVNRERQLALFHEVLALLATMDEPINQMIEADFDGDEAVFRLSDWPEM